jgi:hypothetical protein
VKTFKWMALFVMLGSGFVGVGIGIKNLSSGVESGHAIMPLAGDPPDTEQPSRAAHGADVGAGAMAKRDRSQSGVSVPPTQFISTPLIDHTARAFDAKEMLPPLDAKDMKELLPPGTISTETASPPYFEAMPHSPSGPMLGQVFPMPISIPEPDTAILIMFGLLVFVFGKITKR